MKKTKTRRGSGLATVLVITAIMVTLSFTVAGLSFHHLSATNRMSNTVYAKDLAEAAIAKAIDQIISNPGFGTASGANVSATSSGAPSGAFGALTFDATQAASLTQNFGSGQMTWRRCTNNIASDAAVTGDNITVPGNSVFLSAVGYCQGTFRRVEAVIYVPKFPYAIASSGAISGRGLQITAVKQGGDPTNKSDWMPTSLATNSDVGGLAIDFSGGNITLNGDLQSHSGATLGANTTVRGAERLNAGTQTLPSLNIASYDTAGKTGLHTLPDVIPSTALSGYNRRQGDLLAANGLNLNGGVLFVNGNLNVSGGLSGSGAVIVNGTTTISGTTVFSGTNKVSILSHGAMNIQGDSAASPSQVTGILYSDKSISATYAQLRGTVIANDASGADGKIGITQSQLVQDQVQTDVSVTVNTGSSSHPEAGAGVLYTETPAVYSSGYVNGGIPAAITNMNAPVGSLQAANRTPVASTFSYPTSTTPGTPFYGLPDATTSAGVVSANISIAIDKTNITPARFLDPATGSYVAPINFTANVQDGEGNNYPAGTYKMVVDDVNNAGAFHYVPYTGSVSPMNPTDYVVTINNGAEVPASGSWQTAAVNAMVSSLDTFAQNTRGSGLTATEKSIATSIYTSQVSSFLRNVAPTAAFAIARADSLRGSEPITFQDALDPTYHPVSSTDTWSLSLNDNAIMPLAERIRVMYWRDTP